MMAEDDRVIKNRWNSMSKRAREQKVTSFFVNLLLKSDTSEVTCLIRNYSSKLVLL